MSLSQHPLHRSLHRLQMAFWRRRVLHWLVRAAWLTMLVPLTVITGFYWRGWQIRPLMLVLMMAFVALITVLWAMRPIRLMKMAQRLDERLSLQTRLRTAVEITTTQDTDNLEDNQVVQHLLQETIEIIGQIRSQINVLNRTLWLEMRTLIGITSLLLALIFMNTISPHLPNAASVDLPPPWQEPTAEDILPPDVDLQSPPAPQSPETLDQDQLQNLLEILADALRDEAATRAIADALDRSDIPAAAEETRRLADQLDDLSRTAQRNISERLREGADNIGDMMPILTQALDAGSQALNAGDTLAGADALETVADILESLNDTPEQQSETPQGEATPPPSEAPPESEEAQEQPADQQEAPPTEDSPPVSEQPPEEERLAAEAEPLELESDFEIEDRVLQPAELDAGSSDELTQDSPFAKQAANLVDDLGPDPLTYPWDRREVIRSYFSP